MAVGMGFFRLRSLVLICDTGFEGLFIGLELSMYLRTETAIM
jgi:hypothetical protein